MWSLCEGSLDKWDCLFGLWSSSILIVCVWCRCSVFRSLDLRLFLRRVDFPALLLLTKIPWMRLCLPRVLFVSLLLLVWFHLCVFVELPSRCKRFGVLCSRIWSRLSAPCLAVFWPWREARLQVLLVTGVYRLTPRICCWWLWHCSVFDGVLLGLCGRLLDYIRSPVRLWS